VRAGPGPRWLSVATEFIDLNAQRDVSLAEVAAQAHVSPRTLRLGFRQFYQSTARNYMLQIRLDGAHRELLAANRSTDTVAAIARRWRFRHPGRFSGIYRDRFGVAPSVTLSYKGPSR
jgi:transcriptional regulator GlxA family with amidase domain